MGAFFDCVSHIGENVIGVEDSVDDFVELLVAREVLVVELGVARWVNATKVLHPAELSSRLLDDVPEAQLGSVLHHIGDLSVLVFIALHQAVNQVFDLGVLVEVGDEQIVSTGLGDWYAAC